MPLAFCMRKVSLLLLLMSLTALGGCGKGYRQIVMVKDSNASFVTLLEGGAPPSEQQLWEPNRIVLFRSTSVAMPPLPVGGNTYFSGQEGHIYQLDENLKPKDIGTFDLKLSDTQLAQQYGK